MADLVIFQFDRKDIEAQNFDKYLSVLRTWTIDRELFSRFLHRVVFMVDGYNHDIRDLSQIPQVVSYFKELHKRWPYMINFFLPEHRHYAWWIACVVVEATNYIDGERLKINVDYLRVLEFQTTWFTNANAKVEELMINEQLYVSRQEPMVRSFMELVGL